MLGVTPGFVGVLGGAASGEIPPAPPVNTVAPVISGNTAYGSTLTCTSGTWTGYPAPTITRQWTNAGSPIGGATGLTYQTVAGDVGDAINCVETGTNASGSAGATSNTITPTDPAQQALDLIVAGFAVAPSAPRQAAMKNLISALMGTPARADVPGVSIWASRARLYVLRNSEAQGGRLNWIAPGTGNASVVGTPTFTVDVGYTGFSSGNYLATGFDPLANGGMTRNDCSFGASTSVDQIDNSSAMLAGSLYFGVQPRTSAGALATRNSSSGIDTGAANTGAGLYTVSRSVSTSYDRYKGGALVDSPARASVAIASSLIYIGTHNLSQFTNKPVGLVHFGTHMDAAAVSAFDTAWQAYIAAL